MYRCIYIYTSIYICMYMEYSQLWVTIHLLAAMPSIDPSPWQPPFSLRPSEQGDLPVGLWGCQWELSVVG